MSGETQTSSIRESLNAAVEKLEKTEETNAEATEAGPAADSGDGGGGVGDDSVRPAGDADRSGGADSGVPAGSDSGRARGPDGKFLPKTSGTKAPEAAAPSATKAPVATATPTPAPAAAVSTPTLKAPQSWKADVREKFNALPPEVQQEVLRREAEIAKTVQDVSEPKKFHEQFRAIVAPYEAMIRAEGGEPLKAVAGLLQTAAALRTAPVGHKAQLVAQLVHTYGIPLEALAQALDGAAPAAQQQHQAPQSVDPAAIAQQVEQRVFAQMRQREQQQAAQEMATWAEGKEFLSDVSDDVADILELAVRRGRPMTLDEAYEKACRNHPEVAKVLQQRDAHKSAQAQQVAAQAKANASVSAKTSPAPVAPAAPKGIRATLEEAAAKHSGR